MATQATNDVVVSVPSGFAPYPEVGLTNRVWVNRVYDTVAGQNVLWETIGAPDIALGVSYPGPGTFDPTEGGNDTESHVIQTILEA